MIYLLDVNVLLAMCYAEHIHYRRAKYWLDESLRRETATEFATCSITELGFVRIAGGKETNLAENVTAARQDLSLLKEDWPFTFLNDPLGSDDLPIWVRRPAHVTDGHLMSLATAHEVQLVTLDRRIPGALLIPERLDGPSMVREPSIEYRVEKQHHVHAAGIATGGVS